jgi:transposase-like protein
MPWRASSVMEEKLRFVFEYERDEHSMTDLCSQFGIARETGYVWLRRYRQYGVQGLAELNRAPRLHPNQTPVRIEQAVLELRQAHMTWGPRKLKRVLERDQPGRAWPATSTIGEVVKRAGLVVPRKKRRRTEPYSEPLAAGPETKTKTFLIRKKCQICARSKMSDLSPAVHPDHSSGSASGSAGTKLAREGRIRKGSRRKREDYSIFGIGVSGSQVAQVAFSSRKRHLARI